MIMNNIFKRVSVRKFQDREVEKDKIEMLLRAAMASPSAKNQQPWRFVVVTDKEKIKELSTCSIYSKFAEKAPLIIAVLYDDSNLNAPEFVEIDCAICTENILLEAAELGLGGTMIGVCPDKERMNNVSKVLETKGLKPFTYIPIGYPVEEKEQTDRFDIDKVSFI